MRGASALMGEEVKKNHVMGGAPPWYVGFFL